MSFNSRFWCLIRQKLKNPQTPLAEPLGSAEPQLKNTGLLQRVP